MIIMKGFIASVGWRHAGLSWCRLDKEFTLATCCTESGCVGFQFPSPCCAASQVGQIVRPEVYAAHAHMDNIGLDATLQGLVLHVILCLSCKLQGLHDVLDLLGHDGERGLGCWSGATQVWNGS